jgi:hypothetical protein
VAKFTAINAKLIIGGGKMSKIESIQAVYRIRFFSGNKYYEWHVYDNKREQIIRNFIIKADEMNIGELLHQFKQIGCFISPLHGIFAYGKQAEPMLDLIDQYVIICKLRDQGDYLNGTCV